MLWVNEKQRHQNRRKQGGDSSWPSAYPGTEYNGRNKRKKGHALPKKRVQANPPHRREGNTHNDSRCGSCGKRNSSCVRGFRFRLVFGHGKGRHRVIFLLLFYHRIQALPADGFQTLFIGQSLGKRLEAPGFSSGFQGLFRLCQYLPKIKPGFDVFFIAVHGLMQQRFRRRFFAPYNTCRRRPVRSSRLGSREPGRSDPSRPKGRRRNQRAAGGTSRGLPALPLPPAGLSRVCP